MNPMKSREVTGVEPESNRRTTMDQASYNWEVGEKKLRKSLGNVSMLIT